MKRILTRLGARNYVTPKNTSSKSQQPKEAQKSRNASPKRTITISSGPVGPSAVAASSLLFGNTVPDIEVPEVKFPVSDLRSRYEALLDTAFYTVAENDKDWLLAELNAKKVFSKNQGMKKIVLKVAALALANNGPTASVSLHPFIPVAGEVFFGANYSDGVDDNIQDIVTPGLLVLLLEKALQSSPKRPFNRSLSNKNLQLAKALVETSAGYLIHRTVQDTNNLAEANSTAFEALHEGNKLAALTGDLLVVSLIKNVACTGNNKVLEMVMNSLSEFSTTEIKSQRAFKKVGNVHQFQYPTNLAESVVFSKGFQSALLLSGVSEDSSIAWAGRVGKIMGLMWKTNFDFIKIQRERGQVENINEVNMYLEELRNEADILLCASTICKNHDALAILRQFLYFWASKKFSQL